MSSMTIIILIILGILIIMAGVAFALYKAGFKVDKVKAMLPGVMEMEASRPQSPPASPANTAETGPEVRQRAADGGKITQSGITAPADSAAEIDQQATGKDSEINGSPINLT